MPVTKEIQDHVDLVNNLREQHGLYPLRMSSILMNAAGYKAKSIADFDHFSHIEPRGRNHHQLMVDFGYPSNTWSGENILYGTDGAQETFNVWLNSPPHRENMLNPNFTEIGVALGVEPSWDYSGDVYQAGVQLFGGSETPAPAEGPVVSEGVDETAPKTPKRPRSPKKPRTPRFAPPLQKPRPSLADQIRASLKDLQRRIEKSV